MRTTFTALAQVREPQVQVVEEDHGGARDLAGGCSHARTSHAPPAHPCAAPSPALVRIVHALSPDDQNRVTPESTTVNHQPPNNERAWARSSSCCGPACTCRSTHRACIRARAWGQRCVGRSVQGVGSVPTCQPPLRTHPYTHRAFDDDDDDGCCATCLYSSIQPRRQPRRRRQPAPRVVQSSCKTNNSNRNPGWVGWGRTSFRHVRPDARSTGERGGRAPTARSPAAAPAS